MSSTVDGLRLRRILGRDLWLPPRPYGPDGWTIVSHDRRAHVMVSVDDFPAGSGEEWIHASFGRNRQMPSYEDLVLLYRAAFPERGWAYQVFAPAEQHINIHPYVLHLWGRVDGRSALPDFGAEGSI